MSAGTLKVTNGSNAVVGTGTTFTSDLKSGDVITTTIGGVFYTLFVDTVTSNTAATLTDPFTGPTTTGAAWVAVPALSLNRITAALATQTAEAVRRILQDNANWQAFYSGAGDIVVTLPDGTPTGRQITGPSWAKLKADAGSAWIDRGPLSTTANLNVLNPAITEGEWGKSSTTGLNESNGFPPGAGVGVLKVIAGGRFGGTQIYTDYLANQWVRALTATWNGVDGPWSVWISTGNKSLESTLLTGTAPDLNTYNNSRFYGTFRIAGSLGATVALGWPYDGFGGTVEVVQGYGLGVQQFAESNYGNRYMRYMSSATAWAPWIKQDILAGPNFFTGNADDLLDDGDYPTNSSTTGLPDPALFGLTNPPNNCRLTVRTLRSNTSITQEWTAYGTNTTHNGRKFHREKYSSSPWTAWKEVLDTSSLPFLYGIGGNNVGMDAIDWQTYNFLSGSNLQLRGATMLNAPSPLDTFNTATLSVSVLNVSGDPTSTTSIAWIHLQVAIYSTGGASRRLFHLVARGTSGSRVYNVAEIMTSATATPISAGGTGATTAAAARSALGLGDAATRNVGTTSGTVAAGDDSRLGTVNGKTGGTITSAVSVTGQLGANNLFAATAPAPNTQGTHIGWNAETGTGATDIYNNRGGGNGGFNFRIVNVTNTQELQKFQFRYDGVGLAPGGWQTGSDIHLKENVTPVTRALPAVLSLIGTTWLYKRRKGGSETLTPGVGLIAQQVENICPAAVATHEEMTYFEDDTALLEHKSLDVSGVSAAYHNEAIKALFELVKLALNDPDAARQQIADIEAEAKGLTISLEDLQREQVAVPTETPTVEEPESPDTSASDENQSDIQP